MEDLVSGKHYLSFQLYSWKLAWVLAENFIKKKPTEEASWDERHQFKELKLPNYRQYKKGAYDEKA